MERKVLFYWVAQFLGWGAYFVLSVLLLVNTEQLHITLNLILYIFSSILFSIIVSHGLRYVILLKDLVQGAIVQLILWVLVLSLLAAIILELFQEFFSTQLIKDDFIEGFVPDPIYEFNTNEFVFASFRSTLLFLMWAGFYMAFMFIEKARKQEILNLKWDASKNEIELKNLRAQLNPHFLFNSLNSIRALVGLDPDQAKTAITGLSTLLRSSINLGKQKLVKLEDEMELVKNYLELEQIRFEERLKIDYKIAENSSKCEIPPLMVQTIVENSIKHGIAQIIDGGTIKLESQFVNDELTILITNPGKLNRLAIESGIGIVNTQKRLAILYGENSSFAINQKDDLVEAKIKIRYA